MDRRAFLLASASLALWPGGARAALLGGGTTVALVTADLESHVAVVDLSSGRILRRVPTLAGPQSVESVQPGVAVVAHSSAGALSVIEGSSLRVRSVVRGLGEPRYTAADRRRGHAYVTDSARGEVALVDVFRAGGRAGIVWRAAVGGPARHLSLSPSGEQLWVVLGTKAREVVVLDLRDPRRPRLVAKLRPPFLAHDVCFAPDGRSVWITSGDRNEIAVYDARTRAVRLRLAADAPPQHVSFIAGRAYVTSGDDGLLRVHDRRTGRVRGTVRVPVGSYNVQQGWGVVLTPSLSQGTLCIAAGDGRLVRRVAVSRSSHDACFLFTNRY
jgi:DNA-binding beta-propeller fold protein YncE